MSGWIVSVLEDFLPVLLVDGYLGTFSRILIYKETEPDF